MADQIQLGINITAKDAVSGVLLQIVERLRELALAAGDADAAARFDNLIEELKNAGDGVDDLRDDLDDLRDDLDDAGDGADDAGDDLDDLGDSADGAGDGLGGLSGIVGELAKGLAVLAGLKVLSDLGQQVIQTSAEFETLGVRLETITGSAQAAEQALDWITQFTATTPYQLQDVSKAFANLAAVGLDATRVLPAIGDGVAAVGGGADEINRVVTALSQMQSKGKVSAEELMQIAETGIPVFQILQQQLNLTSAQMGNIGNAGLSVNQVINALSDGINQRFGGAMQQQSQTFGGIMSNMQDKWTMFLKGIGDAGMFDAWKGAMANASAEADNNSAALARLQASLSNIGESGATVFSGLVTAAGVLLQGVDMVLVGWQKLAVLIGSGFDFEAAAQAGEVAQETVAQISEAEKQLAKEIQATQAQIADKEKELLDKRMESAKRAESLAVTVAQRQMTEQDRVLDKARRDQQEAINLEEEYANRIIDLRRQLADEAISDEDRLREIRRRTMSESGAEADKVIQANEKLAASQAALASGDTDAAKKLAEDAKQLAAGLNDAAQAEGLFTQAAAASRAVTEAQLKTAEETQAGLQKIIAGDEGITVNADVSEAMSELEQLKAKLDGLQDKTVTVTVKTAEAKAGGGFVGLARGGPLPGFGGGDIVPAMLEPGEFVVRKDRARDFADLLHAINYAPANALRNIQLPKFATGGLVPPAPSFSGNGKHSSAPPAGYSDTVRVELSMPGGQRANLLGERAEAARLVEMFKQFGRGVR